MSQVTQEQGEKILKPYYELFVSFYNKSIADWRNVVSLYPDLSPRCRAVFIYDRVRSYTRAHFPPENIHERGGRFFLRFGNVAARYKKLKNSRPSCIPTQMTMKLDSQQLVLGEELLPLTLINIGYSANKAHTDYKFEINCLEDNEIVWRIDITEYNEIGKTVDVSVEEAPEGKKKTKVRIKAQ
jgi:hypothetical protein